MENRRFTLEEANYLVPWLERTFERLSSSVRQLEAMKERMDELLKMQHRLNGTFERHNEMDQLQSELNGLDRDLQGIIREISSEGIIIRDVARGLVDLLHFRDGREVYLCWIRGEESFKFWHETDRGFEHRQPL